MFMPSFRTAGLAALACAALLAGCDEAEPVRTTKPPAAQKPAPGPKLAELSREMVAAVSSGKTANAIGMHFALGAPPAVGQALPVRIAIVPHRKFLSVRAHFEGPDGMAVASGDTYGPKTDVAAEITLEHELILMPGREGMFMVTASIDTEGDEGSVTRIFSIPVIVIPAQSESAAPPAPPAAAAGAADSSAK
jgi:hypothetical protein